MNYEGIEYVIRAGLGRNEWTIVISFPDASEPLTWSSVISFQGTREEVNSEARKLAKTAKGKSRATSQRQN